jgi:hypothetical protein
MVSKRLITTGLILIFLGTTLLSGGVPLSVAAALGRVCLFGDLIGEGRVGLDDVIFALRIAAGLDNGAQACRTADVDRDDRIGLAEAIHGLSVLSGLGE